MHAITRSGWVEVITGSMFSGKTEELIRRLRRAEIAGQEVAVFTPALDDRYGEATIGSHNGRRWEATVIETDDEGPRSIFDQLDGEAVVAIDEANFFSVALVDVCEALAADGRRVIVSGTDQTFRGEPFHPLPELMAVAEYVDKFQAICSQCGEPASRNQRLVDGEPAHRDDPTIVVGGHERSRDSRASPPSEKLDVEETYEARCRNCHTVRSD